MIYAVDQLHQLIDARRANRQFTYWCPHCSHKVYLRDGTKKIAHFAHYKQADAYCNKGEGAEHYLLKYKLAEYYKVHGYGVSIEPYIKSALQYPDIVVEQRYAIEIQFSQINCDFVLKRTNGLTLNNLNVVWVIKNPNYNKRKYLLFLTRFQRAFINPRNRTLFAWDWVNQKLLLYYNIQFLGGKSFRAQCKVISPGEIILTNQISEDIKLYKLSYSKVKQYINQCQHRHSVLEPTLSVIYNLRLQINDVCNCFGLIFKEQLFIQSHPVYWQLQLYYLFYTGTYTFDSFKELLKFNTFYLNDMNQTEIVQSIVNQFKLYYRIFNCNNVQKNR